MGSILKGLYISTKYKGAHPVQWIRAASISEFTSWLKILPPKKKILLTLDPSVDGALDLMNKIYPDPRVVFGLGHANLNLDPLDHKLGKETDHEIYKKAKAKGLRVVIHFNNAKGPRKTRTWGDFLFPILSDHSTYTMIIPDGYHLDEPIVTSIVPAFYDGIILSTDCLSAAGASPGKKSFGSQEYEIKAGDKVAWLNRDEGTFIGSLCTPDQGLSNILQWCGDKLTLPQIWQMASLNPAKMLGLDNIIGSSRPGLAANFVIFDWHGPGRPIKIGKTIINGEIYYDHQ